MQALVQVYGTTLSAIVWLLAATWVLGLIIVPQLFVIEQSLWWKEKSAEEFEVTQRIDRLYNDVMLWQLDLSSATPADTSTP